MTPDRPLDLDRLVARAVAVAVQRSCLTPLPAADPEAFAERVRHQRVSGLVRSATRHGAFEGWPDELGSLLDEVHTDGLRLALAAEALCMHTTQLFQQRGIPHLVLKGCVTAHLDYDQPSERIFGDADVLVPRPEYHRALGLLGGAGYRRLEPAFRVGWEQRYGKDIPFRAPKGSELDLHLGIVGGSFGVRMDEALLFRHTEQFEVGGLSLQAMDQIGRLIHAAIHSVSSQVMALSSAADVALLWSDRELTVGQVEERTRELGCTALVASGIVRVWDELALPGSELATWARDVQPSTDEQRAIARLRRGNSPAVRLDAARTMPLARRPGYLVPLVCPSRAYLRHRGQRWPDHARALSRRLVRRRKVQPPAGGAT